MHVSWLGIFFWVGLFTWFSITVWARFLREKERQLTLRAFAESGNALDPATLEKLFPMQAWQREPQWTPTPHSVARGLLIGGIVMLFLGIGLLIGAQLIARIAQEALWGMSTGGVMVSCLGLGLITASIVTRRMAESDRKALLDKAEQGQ